MLHFVNTYATKHSVYMNLLSDILQVRLLGGNQISFSSLSFPCLPLDEFAAGCCRLLAVFMHGCLF